MNAWDVLADAMKGIIQMTITYWRDKGIKVLNVEHILHTMIRRNVAIVKRVFEHFDIDIDQVRQDIEDAEFVKDFVPEDKRTISLLKIYFDISIGECISTALKFITKNGHSNKEIGIDHFFLAMCVSDTSKLSIYFTQLGIDPEVVRDFILEDGGAELANTMSDITPDDDNSIIDKNSSNGSATDTMDPEDFAKEQQRQKISEMKPKNPNKTPTLDELGINMLDLVKKGAISKVIGRDKETELLMEILCRKNKRNVLLVGEAGVGKTAIVEGFAINLFKHKVPLCLKDKRLYQLDTASLVAGTVFRGQFEQRCKNLVDELVTAKNTIVFIDEIHTIIGAGNGMGGADVGNILKPELARGTIQLIGATTQDEYEKYLKSDQALERRFQVINVEEPSEEDAINILEGLRPSFEEFHNIRIDDSAIKAAVRLSKQYIPLRYLPDKCIDLIDIAGARPQLKTMDVPEEIENLREELDVTKGEKDAAARAGDAENRIRLYRKQQDIEKKLKAAESNYYDNIQEEVVDVTDSDICDVVSRLTDIPSQKISESDASKLLNLESIIKERLIGQDDAVKTVCKAIRRARTDLHDRKKPIGNFLFLGPTGVGKTEICRQLALELFGKEANLLKFDMSEYTERFDVSKLLGSAPGFVGYDEGGLLTNAIRKNPYSIVLFDEIEKAHKDIYNTFLQILEDGVVTDGKGRKAFFNNAIIVFTGNIGAEKAFNYHGSFGFGTSQTSKDRNEEVMKIIRKEAEDYFRPEFLNRLDDIVVFNQLQHDDVKKIVDLQLDKLNKRIEYRDMKIEITEAMHEHIIDKGYNVKFGARPINRTIQSMIEDNMADKLLLGEYTDGMTIRFDFKNDEIVQSVVEKK